MTANARPGTRAAQRSPKRLSLAMPVRIQSVARALRILDTLTQHPEGLGVGDIAKRLELNVSTTHHLVNTLVDADYVTQLDSGLYQLGHAVSRLYGAYALIQQPEARLLKLLNQLVNSTQETGYLAGWQGDEVVVQAIAEGSQQLRVGGLQPGYRGYTHARAAGKALLACLDPAPLDAYLATHPLERRTAHTLTTPAALKADLRQILRQGFALDQEEFVDGIGCVAAPIFAADGQAVSAFSISAPAWRLTQNFKPFVAAVQEAAKEASAILGYRPGTVRADGARRPRNGKAG
jgi:DNA-binding IclR family transcriptional regulator